METKLTPILLDAANDLSAFCSKDEKRQILQGIHVNGCTEACDGRILIRVPFVPIPADEFPPVSTASNDRKDCIIPAKQLTEALSKAKGMTLPVLNTVRLSTRPGEGTAPLRAQLVTTDLDNQRMIEAKTIDGNYPNTEQVIPKDEPKLSICLSSTYLRKIADYAEKHGVDKHGDNQGCPIRIDLVDELSPARFTIPLHDGRQAKIVLMPMRMI